MSTHLILRLEGPLQAWGDVAVDRIRKTRAFPSMSGVAGLLGSALGWTYADGDRTTALQDSLRMAVREDRPGQLLRDFQTANLGRETETWSTRGRVRRGGSVSDGTQMLEKSYLADASFLVAISLTESAPVTVEELKAALETPARPLFLGRKSCPPATPVLEGVTEASTPLEAVRAWPAAASGPVRCWYALGEGPESVNVHNVWDRRDFAANRFVGSRRIVESSIQVEAQV